MTDNADQTQFLTDLPRAERDATVVLDAPLFPPSFGRSPVADPPTIELAWSDVAALREQAGAEHPALQPAPLTGQSAELPLADVGSMTHFLPNPWDVPDSPPTPERRRPGLPRRVLLLTGALAAAGLLALAGRAFYLSQSSDASEPAAAVEEIAAEPEAIDEPAVVEQSEPAPAEPDLSVSEGQPASAPPVVEVATVDSPTGDRLADRIDPPVEVADAALAEASQPTEETAPLEAAQVAEAEQPAAEEAAEATAETAPEEESQPAAAELPIAQPAPPAPAPVASAEAAAEQPAAAPEKRRRHDEGDDHSRRARDGNSAVGKILPPILSVFGQR